MVYGNIIFLSFIGTSQHLPILIHSSLQSMLSHLRLLQTFKDGMDFYFAERQQGLKFVDFLTNHVPMTLKYTKKLLTADHKSNTGKFKHNLMVTIAPVCKVR
jgi:NMD protein affecting ribosome stability and mRNA decay